MDKTVICLWCGSKLTYKEEDENFSGKCKKCGTIVTLNEEYNVIQLEIKERVAAGSLFGWTIIAIFVFSIVFIAFFSPIIGYLHLLLLLPVDSLRKKFLRTPQSTEKRLEAIEHKLKCGYGYYVLRKEDVSERDISHGEENDHRGGSRGEDAQEPADVATGV